MALGEDVIEEVLLREGEVGDPDEGRLLCGGDGQQQQGGHVERVRQNWYRHLGFREVRLIDSAERFGNVTYQDVVTFV